MYFEVRQLFSSLCYDHMKYCDLRRINAQFSRKTSLNSLQEPRCHIVVLYSKFNKTCTVQQLEPLCPVWREVLILHQMVCSKNVKSFHTLSYVHMTLFEFRRVRVQIFSKNLDIHFFKSPNVIWSYCIKNYSFSGIGKHFVIYFAQFDRKCGYLVKLSNLKILQELISLQSDHVKFLQNQSASIFMKSPNAIRSYYILYYKTVPWAASNSRSLVHQFYQQDTCCVLSMLWV